MNTRDGTFNSLNSSMETQTSRNRLYITTMDHKNWIYADILSTIVAHFIIFPLICYLATQGREARCNLHGWGFWQL